MRTSLTSVFLSCVLISSSNNGVYGRGVLPRGAPTIAESQSSLAGDSNSTSPSAVLSSSSPSSVTSTPAPSTYTSSATGAASTTLTAPSLTATSILVGGATPDAPQVGVTETSLAVPTGAA
ncbi:hypothetical protein LTR53_005879, partial [Teratosphaeriaceae sp. CCFEE 6253]